jgi:hypothetical protein
MAQVDASTADVTGVHRPWRGDRMFLLMLTDEPESVATPFEQWCDTMDLHPDDSRSWALYVAFVGAESHTPAAS